MMKTFATLIFLTSLVQANTEPNLSYDLNTIKGCSYWYDNTGTRTCESIRTAWEISPETFHRWNPSISVNCEGWGEHSYCVLVNAEETSSTTTAAKTTSTPATSTSTGPVPVWTDHGCYKDNASVHPLQTQLPSVDKLTRSKCEDKCWSSGYPYVGLKAGTECWCGSYVQSDWSASLEDCGTVCPGNSSETCGGTGVFNVLEGNRPPPLPSSTSTSTSALPSTSSAPPPSETAFVLTSRYNKDCTGAANNEVLVRTNSDGVCIDTSCSVGSLDIASLGSCPDGDVQVSYWEKPGCSGAWYGYGYANRGSCKGLWEDGWNTQSLHLRCAKKSEDCVTKGTCTYSPAPDRGICRPPPQDPGVAFKLKSHYHGDCTGDVHNDVTIKSGTNGQCINIDCQVASLDIDSIGDCPSGNVQLSYWQGDNCSGAWYGYGYASRGSCKTLWKAGYVNKSLWLRCADPSKDCVHQGTCKEDPEPTQNIC